MNLLAIDTANAKLQTLKDNEVRLHNEEAKLMDELSSII